MSRTTEGFATDHEPKTGHQPGAVAILAATALGGVIGSRLGKAPLVLAAGAATLALLNAKKTTPAQCVPPRPRQPAPEPVTESAPDHQPAQSQIDQWIARQTELDSQKAVVPLPVTTGIEELDEFVPPSFLMDEADDASPAASYDAFAHLTTLPPFTIGPAQNPAPLQSLESTASAPSAASSLLLGVEPLPSLGAEFPEPQRQTVSEPAFVCAAPVFDGGVFPDEIEVPVPEEPLVHLLPVPSPLVEPAEPPEPAMESVQEIPVSLAAPGDASFDPPLAAAPHDPWHMATPPPAQPKVAAPPPTGPLIEAEIVLRPRTAISNAVIPRGQTVSPRFTKTNAAAGLPEFAASVDAAVRPPPACESPPRKAWRSWWRGD